MATAASNALPPCSSTAIPAAEASQCVEATMPNVPASSGLVVNSGISPMTRSSHQARRVALCVGWRATGTYSMITQCYYPATMR